MRRTVQLQLTAHASAGGTGSGIRGVGRAAPTAVDADLGLQDAVVVEDQAAKDEATRVEYNWETEWYPMYLQKQLPTDAPLGLTVFDVPLVLFYDGKGVLNCLEDRCPHR